MESVAPALILDVHLAEFAESLDLSLVAAPGDGHGLKATLGFVPGDRLVLLAVGELNALELGAGGDAAVGRIEQGLVPGQGCIRAAGHLVELGLPQSDLLAVEPDRSVLAEQLELALGGRLIAHGHRGPEYIRPDHRLQDLRIAVDQPRRPPEGGVGAGELALARLIHGAPEVGLEVILQQFMLQGGFRLARAMKHGERDGAAQMHALVAPRGLILDQRCVEGPEGLDLQPVGEKMGRKREPRARPFRALGLRRAADQPRHALARVAHAGLFPSYTVDDAAGLGRIGGLRAGLRRAERAHGQAASAADRDMVHARAQRHVVRDGARDQPVHRSVEPDFDETVRLGQGRAGAEGGGYGELLARFARDPVDRRHARERNDQRILPALVRLPRRPKQGGSGDALVSGRQRPGVAIGCEADHASLAGL